MQLPWARSHHGPPGRQPIHVHRASVPTPASPTDASRIFRRRMVTTARNQDIHSLELQKGRDDAQETSGHRGQVHRLPTGPNEVRKARVSHRAVGASRDCYNTTRSSERFAKERGVHWTLMGASRILHPSVALGRMEVKTAATTAKGWKRTNTCALLRRHTPDCGILVTRVDYFTFRSGSQPQRSLRPHP